MEAGSDKPPSMPECLAARTKSLILMQVSSELETQFSKLLPPQLWHRHHQCLREPWTAFRGPMVRLHKPGWLFRGSTTWMLEKAGALTYLGSILG